MWRCEPPLERRFHVYGQELAALQWPGEGMPILALHGWLDNAASFVPLAGKLPNPMVALDFAGHGHSDHRPPHQATHYVDHVRDVMAVADALGWERFVLIGHSMGAGVASLVAGTFVDRVDRLVLIEGLGPLATTGEEAPDTLRKAIEQMQALPGKRKPVYNDPELAVAARVPALGGLEEASARLLCERGLEPVTGGWTWRADARLRLTSSLRLTEEQVEAFVRAIRAPTLLILGDQGLGGGSRSEHRIGWLADVTVGRLPGRHHLHMDDPAPVATEIRDFLKRTGGT